MFVIAVFLASISWLYFFYMEALATAIFGISRAFYLYKKDFKRVVSKLLYILLHAILGVLMAAVVLLPMVYAYMGDSRMGISNSVPMLYSRFFYERLFAVFVSNDSPYDLCGGFVSATLLAIALLLKKPKKNAFLIFLNFICLISVCIPILGKVWNGFSYVSERWSFVIAMPIAYDLVHVWDDFEDNKKYLFISMAIILGLSVFSAWSRTERVFVPMGLCILFLLVSTIRTDRLKQGLKQSLMILIVVLNIFYIFEFNLSPRGGNAMDDLMNIEDVQNFMSLTEANIIKDYMKDDDFCRYTGNNLTNNASMTFGTHSTNFYFSITNPSDQRFRSLMNLRDRLTWQLMGYDDRAPLESLANVKYYVANDWYTGNIPFGFRQIDSKGNYIIFENDYVLPFGYTYEKAISYDQWYEMNPLYKQEAMMEAVVLERNNDNSVKLNSDIQSLEYTITPSEGLELKDHSIIVKEKNASITLHFNDSPGKELYFSVNGLYFDDIYSVVENDQTEAHIRVETPDGKFSYIYYETPTHRYFNGKNGFICYLGNHDKAMNEVKVIFSLAGEYSFDVIGIDAVDVSNYGAFISKLSEDRLHDVVFDANTIKGRIDLNDEKYLVLSVPYSEGWKAFIDGQSAELLKANEHYMALQLGKGEHEIELKYLTPGLKGGAIVSTLSILGFAVYACMEKKRAEK